MLDRLKNTIFVLLPNLLKYRQSKDAANSDKEHLKPFFLKHKALTTKDKILIRKKWGAIKELPISRGFEFYYGLKCLDMFDHNISSSMSATMEAFNGKNNLYGINGSFLCCNGHNSC